MADDSISNSLVLPRRQLFEESEQQLSVTFPFDYKTHSSHRSDSTDTEDIKHLVVDPNPNPKSLFDT